MTPDGKRLSVVEASKDSLATKLEAQNYKLELYVRLVSMKPLSPGFILLRSASSATTRFSAEVRYWEPNVALPRLLVCHAFILWELIKHGRHISPLSQSTDLIVCLDKLQKITLQGALGDAFLDLHMAVDPDYRPPLEFFTGSPPPFENPTYEYLWNTVQMTERIFHTNTSAFVS